MSFWGRLGDVLVSAAETIVPAAIQAAPAFIQYNESKKARKRAAKQQRRIARAGIAPTAGPGFYPPSSQPLSQAALADAFTGGQTAMPTYFLPGGAPVSVGYPMNGGSTLGGALTNVLQGLTGTGSLEGSISGGWGAPAGIPMGTVVAGGTSTAGYPSTIFQQVPTVTRTVARAPRQIILQNPVSGGLHYFVNRGRPILFSGDLAACKRVNKVAARARRGMGSRRRAAVRRRR